MHTDLMSWLDARLTEVPESLRTRIMDAVKGGLSGSRTAKQLPESLRRIGEALMREAESAPPTRDTAMTLLAADALMTFACEAVAEQDPEHLSELR